MNELSLLAQKYDTDKGVSGARWKDTYHGFTETYHSYLNPLRQNKFILLEIGVGGYNSLNDGGQSLGMWAEYFPNAEIHGLDIHKKVLNGRFITHQGSASDPAFLEKLITKIGTPTVIIDDGSHMNSDLITAFDTLFPYLTTGGIYIAEDLHIAYNNPANTGERQESMISHLLQQCFLLNNGVGDITPPKLGLKSIHFYNGFAIINK